MSWLAKYPGHCSECGEAFAVGTRVMRTSDGEICHTDDGCPPYVPLPVQPGEDLCTRCWLVHAGEC